MLFKTYLSLTGIYSAKWLNLGQNGIEMKFLGMKWTGANIAAERQEAVHSVLYPEARSKEPSIFRRRISKSITTYILFKNYLLLLLSDFFCLIFL